MVLPDYFTHFEPSQSLGGAKTGDPLEKPHDLMQSELGLSHYAQTGFASFNHLAMGVALLALRTSNEFTHTHIVQGVLYKAKKKKLCLL